MRIFRLHSWIFLVAVTFLSGVGAGPDLSHGLGAILKGENGTRGKICGCVEDDCQCGAPCCAPRDEEPSPSCCAPSAEASCCDGPGVEDSASSTALSRWALTASCGCSGALGEKVFTAVDKIIPGSPSRPGPPAHSLRYLPGKVGALLERADAPDKIPIFS